MTKPDRKPMGRPALAAGKAKAASVTLRMTVAEREKLQAAAMAAGESLSIWARRTLLDAAG